METDSTETLDILFGMEQAAIDRDLVVVEDKIRRVGAELSSLSAIPLDAKTSETNARLLHLLMVQAHELCRHEAVASEIKTFYAAFGAGHVAQEVESVATSKDTLAELSSRMDTIRVREGLAEDEFWAFKHEGPPDYQELSAEFGRILERVTDTVFLFALRRYRLGDVADLFETDRVLFEIQREVGRRVIFPSLDDNTEKLMEDYFRREYGERAIERVRLRTGELRGKKA
jgi:hypothetical protein